MTAEQITARRAALEAERAALEAELARREARDIASLLFLKPGLPLNPAELAELDLLPRKHHDD